MFNDRDVLVTYRLLEYPNETAQSWPIARRERDQLQISLVPVARVAGRSASGGKKNTA